MNQQMNRADTGDTFVRDVPLRVDPTRSVDGRETGILVRAIERRPTRNIRHRHATSRQLVSLAALPRRRKPLGRERRRSSAGA
jgi:hypothetical protein